MYSEVNNLSLDILNAVIWHLYSNGEYRGAKLIERKRDTQAMTTYDKALEAFKQREAVYNDIDRRVTHLSASNRKPDDTLNIINSIQEAPILAKVYFTFVVNPVKLKQIDNMNELYNRVTYAYLYTFEGWREGNTFDLKSLGFIRATFSTVERNVRLIKEDKPHIFNDSVIRESRLKENKTRDSFANNIAGLEPL